MQKILTLKFTLDVSVSDAHSEEECERLRNALLTYDLRGCLHNEAKYGPFVQGTVSPLNVSVTCVDAT